MAGKKSRQALVDVLMKETDLGTSLAEWKTQAPAQPAEKVGEPVVEARPARPAWPLVSLFATPLVVAMSAPGCIFSATVYFKFGKPELKCRDDS